MAQPDPVRIESLNSQGTGVRAEFERLGDRFGHTIYFVDIDNHRAVWRSHPTLPGQPVFQELHQQQTTKQQAILFLSGAVTGVHWSMSVEAATPGRLSFDVAARVAKPRVLEAIHYERLDGSLNAIAGAMQFLVHESVTVLHQDNYNVALHRATAGEINTPATIRWQYSVEVAMS
ncbi:MAG: hypothetical protein ACR2NU_13875 [Aeoliella sp.]